MGQKKLIRFEAIKHFSNVLEYPQDMQGKWYTHFKNENPLTLESIYEYFYLENS